MNKKGSCIVISCISIMATAVILMTVLLILICISEEKSFNHVLINHGSLIAGLLALIAAIATIFFQNWNTTRQIESNQFTLEKNRFNDKKEALYKVLIELEKAILDVSSNIPKKVIYGDLDSRGDQTYFIHSSYGVIARFNDLKVVIYQYDFMPKEMMGRYINYVDLYIQLLTVKPEKLSDLLVFIESLKILREPQIADLANEIRAYINRGVALDIHNSTIERYLGRIDRVFKPLSKGVIHEVLVREYSCNQ